MREGTRLIPIARPTQGLGSVGRDATTYLAHRALGDAQPPRPFGLTHERGGPAPFFSLLFIFYIFKNILDLKQSAHKKIMIFTFFDFFTKSKNVPVFQKRCRVPRFQKIFTIFDNFNNFE